jgi:hypothetical protein
MKKGEGQEKSEKQKAKSKKRKAEPSLWEQAQKAPGKAA